MGRHLSLLLDSNRLESSEVLLDLLLADFDVDFRHVSSSVIRSDGLLHGFGDL